MTLRGTTWALVQADYTKPALVAVCVLMGVATARGVWRLSKRIVAWFLHELGDVLDERLGVVVAEFRINGGATIKDALNRLERRTEAIEAGQAEGAAERRAQAEAMTYFGRQLEDVRALVEQEREINALAREGRIDRRTP